MKPHPNSAFTLVEILIVVVILAVLAAVVIPQFFDTTEDANKSSVLINLHTLRSQIQIYRLEHDGTLPGADLMELATQTDKNGNLGGGNRYGPYVNELPANPFTASAAVKTITNSPAKDTDVSDSHGWLYNTTTGGVWISHVDYYAE